MGGRRRGERKGGKEACHHVVAPKSEHGRQARKSERGVVLAKDAAPPMPNARPALMPRVASTQLALAPPPAGAPRNSAPHVALPCIPLSPEERAWILSEERLFEKAFFKIDRLARQHAHDRQQLEAYVGGMEFVNPVLAFRLG